MATPMSAALSAGASLTPSPVIDTTLPVCFSSRTMRSLSSGATRAITPISGSCASSSSSLMAANWRPVMARPSMPSSPAIAAARGRMVAGDHPHPDAGRLALGDRRLGLRPRRVDDAHHRQQGEVAHLLDQVAVGVEEAGSKSRCATTMTRSPAAAMRSLASSAKARLSSVIGMTAPSGCRYGVPREISTSGAPLT
jgi:hypothetical protein